MDILARGVESWNSWRIDNTSIFPDLNGAVLANINLRSANFSHADLSGADLHNADLNHADFRDARVGAAIFRNSFLISADFRRARCGADFTGAVLIDADLREASFRGALLYGADLSRSNLIGTKGLDCQMLKQSVGWETALRDSDLSCGKSTPNAVDVYRSSIIDLLDQLKHMLNDPKIQIAFDFLQDLPDQPYDEDGSRRLGIGGNYPPVTIDGVKKIVEETEDEIKKRDGDRVAIEKLWIQLKRYGNIFMENFSSSAGTLAAGAITSVAVIAAASGFAQIFDRVAGLIRMFLDALQI